MDVYTGIGNIAYGCICGKAFFSKFVQYSRKKAELLMFGSGTADGSNKGAWIELVSTNWKRRARTILCDLNPLL